MENLSTAQVLLGAARYASACELEKLTDLAATRQDVLNTSILLRVLYTYLPVEALSEYTKEVTQLFNHVEQEFKNYSRLDHDLEHGNELIQGTERALQSFTLDSIQETDNEYNDPFSDFIIALAHKSEALDGITDEILQLVQTFAVNHAALDLWMHTYLLPIAKLQNDFYPDSNGQLLTVDLERAPGVAGIDMLLRHATQAGPSAEIGRDLQEIVSPWVVGASRAKRRKLSSTATDCMPSFHGVHEWLLDEAQQDFSLAVKATLEWDGPAAVMQKDEDDTHDEHISYIQAVIALAYVADEDYSRDTQQRRRLAMRAAELAQLMPPDFDNEMPNISDLDTLSRASRADILQDNLLRKGNPFTTPSTDSLEFLYALLTTQQMLQKYKMISTMTSVASAALFSSKDQQFQELRRIAGQIPKLTKSETSWPAHRDRLLWLTSWQGHKSLQVTQRIAYFGRLSYEEVEKELLAHMLSAADYDSIKAIYISPAKPPLAPKVVRDAVITAIHEAYENASNGNRTRGGIKRASDLLRAFEKDFDEKEEFVQLEHLMRATHSLSFYQLTLTHGVPFKPANIRVSRDPLSLIEKVLEQNSKAYTKLDDLLWIARNFVLAGLPTHSKQSYLPSTNDSMEAKLQAAEHKVTYLAINAALADDDFDTAYSLITTRFTTFSSISADTATTDDMSWRAADAAGKYQPTNKPSNLHQQISSLSQRMDLLSQALRLAPADQLLDILDSWQKCEEQMNNLKSEAIAEERAFDSQNNGLLPGGFGADDRDLDSAENSQWSARRAANATAPSYEEEAPIGLFDMARGAASSIRKSAFPLRGARQLDSKGRDTAILQSASRASDEYDRPGSADGDGSQRVRKRDMLSNAVTGTLVSGMGWVLGAPATRPDPAQQ